MIVVPKPIPVPYFHPASAPTTVKRDHTLPASPFQSGRLARARPAAPLPVPLPIQAHPPSPISSPSPKQPSRNRRRKSPPRQRVPAPVPAPTHGHSHSLSGLGGEMDLVLDYTDFTRVTPPHTPPPLHHRSATFPFAAPSPATTPVAVPSARPPYTPTHSYKHVPNHARSPSVPIFSSSYPGHSPSSFGERYANSGFQNSPPPRDLPKPSFLLPKPKSSILDDEDPFI